MILKISNFDLKQIADSGQCFRWKKIEDNDFIKYAIPAFGKVLYLSQKDDEFEFSCNEDEFNLLWKHYLDLDRDYSELENKILSSDDSHLIDSFKIGSGIRILHQDLWEIIFSFMISQNNNIKRISKSIELICRKCGVLSSNSLDIFSFPSVNDIPLEIFDDSSLGLGYRAAYLRELCEFLLDNVNWLDELKKMSYEDAFDSLIKRKGIGKKVANCICLFGLGHIDSFPIDTHVKQLLEKYYPEGIDLSLFKGQEGIIQQYLFYYELINK